MDATQTAVRPTYSPPTLAGAYIDWAQARTEGYEPTARQQLVLQAVESALKACCFSHDAVVNHCGQWFGLAPHQVQDHEFSLDCYLARGHLEAKARLSAERQAWDQLQPEVGLRLGSLVFNDGKRTTEVEIVKVEAVARWVHVSGMHGRVRVELRCHGLAIAKAMDTAKDRRLRRTTFEAFVQQRSKATRRASPTSVTVPTPAT